MHKNNGGKTSSLVILLIASLTISALAGIQFMATAVAAGYTEKVGTVDGVNYVVRFPDSWNGMLVVVTTPGGITPVVDPRTSSFNSTAAVFLGKGYAVAGSNYGGGVGYCYTKAVSSTYTITKYIVDTYHITGKVFLYGNSMGANFALAIGQKHPELYAGVLDLGGSKDAKAHYAYYDMVANMTLAQLRSYLNLPPQYNDTMVQTVKNTYVGFLMAYQNETGGTPQQVPAEYEIRSNINYPNITVPVITVHSSTDPLVPVSQTTTYQAAVAAAGRSALYRVYITPPEVNATIESFIRFDELVGWANAADGWTMTVTGRSLKVYPDLKEYVWQKNATMLPSGPYDKIGLHRLVKTGIMPKGVVFLTNCPTWGMGEASISNPANDTFTKYESYNQAIYWANRGFDVYAVDFRTHFAPKPLNASAALYAANWGLDVWVSDIKEAAEKVKSVSGAPKFFISGECSGGGAALNYAAKYWRTDLKGIILLDPTYQGVTGHPIVGTMNGTNTYNLTKGIESLNSANNWTREDFPQVFKDISLYALQNPGAPAVNPATNQSFTPPLNPSTNKTWTNVTEWYTYMAYNNFASSTPAPGLYANTVGGYTNISQLEYAVANSEFLPWRMLLENQAMSDWVNCPYLAYDYDDHYREIGVPILVFGAELSTNRTGTFGFVNGISNTDFTPVMLKNYGHTDVFFGTYSARDVSEPAYQWMLGHLSTLDVSAFQSVTVMPGWTWWFFAQNNGGSTPYVYQWYEGLYPIQGQTSMVLPVTKTTPGVFSFYCRVTDKDGTTTTSNAITLTVIG